MTILDYVAIGVLMVLILLATPRLFARPISLACVGGQREISPPSQGSKSA